MDKNEIDKKLEQKNLFYVSKIVYKEKEYIKAIKETRTGIEYVYYMIEEDSLREVSDKELINYFMENYGGKARNIIC